MRHEKENRPPLYIRDDYDPKKQEEWLRKQKEEKEKKERRGCEIVDFDYTKDLLIDEVLL